MNTIYEIALRLYALAITLASPFNTKAALWKQGRQNWQNSLKEHLNNSKQSQKVAWFHCASLGEFEQGRPVIELFREKNPNYKILLTFFSPSGYELKKNYEKADYVSYLPLDTKKNAQEFLNIVNPEVVVFVKYEFWKNILTELHQKGCKTYIISAIFRENQHFFKFYGNFFVKILQQFTHLFVQNETSKTLLNSVNINNVTVCGDTRFDRVYDIAQQKEEIVIFKEFAQDKKVFITGSSWEKDDEITCSLIAQFNDLKFIIAPHELGNSKIENLAKTIKNAGKKVVLYTEIDENTDISSFDVIIINTIGILSKVYQYAHFAYIGGGFGVGIHNTLEAAVYGLPIIFGPNYTRFSEAVELEKMGIAKPIHNENEAQKWLAELLQNENSQKEISVKCKQFVQANIGACKKIIDFPLV